MSQTSLVIPVADEPKNSTLAFALKSMTAYGPDLAPVLIGSPTVVPHYLKPYANGQWLPFIQPSLNPVHTTTRMLLLALESPDVTDPFFWSNDDIFLRDSIQWYHLAEAGATARDKLEKSPKLGLHGKLAWATHNLLVEHGRPTWDYERHVPYRVHKDKMLEALSLSLEVNPRSLYFNLFRDHPVAVLRDVKAHVVSDLKTIEGPIFSTGARFPQSVLERELADLL